MKNSMIKQVNFMLAAVASNYMESFQGDILYDQVSIISTLDRRGEIELYVGKSHFDTENRFVNAYKASIDEARKQARKDGWADWVILLRKVGEYSLTATFTKERDDAKEFPFERLYTWERIENEDKIIYKPKQ